MSSASGEASGIETKENFGAELYSVEGVDLFIKNIEQKFSKSCLLPTVTSFMKSEGISEKNILDIGCGSGYWCYQAAKYGGKSVKGFDIQEKMVQAAKKLTAQFTQVSVCVGNVQNMPYGDNSFDIAFSMFVTCGLPAEVLVKHYRELYRVLVPGGKALVTNFSNSAYEKLYVADEADEKVINDKITEIIAGLPRHPTQQQMIEAFKDMKGLLRACLALDQFGSVYLVTNKSQLTNGQRIWFITAIMIFPDYFYDEQYSVDQIVASGLCIDKIDNCYAKEISPKSYFEHPIMYLFYLSKPLC